MDFITNIQLYLKGLAMQITYLMQTVYLMQRTLIPLMDTYSQ